MHHVGFLLWLQAGLAVNSLVGASAAFVSRLALCHRRAAAAD
jgi:hypothetical protein